MEEEQRVYVEDLKKQKLDEILNLPYGYFMREVFLDEMEFINLNETNRSNACNGHTTCGFVL